MEALWECKINSSTYKAYSALDCQALERAYNAKFDSARNKVEIMGGEYFVNVNQLLQYKSNDLMRQRPVRRRMIPSSLSGDLSAPSPMTTSPPPPTTKEEPVHSSTGQKRSRTSSGGLDDEVLEVVAPHKASNLHEGRKETTTTVSGPHEGRKEVTHTNTNKPASMFDRPSAKPVGGNASGGSSSGVVLMERFAGTCMHLYCPPPSSTKTPTTQYKLAGSDKVIATSAPRHVLEVLSRALANVPPINKSPLATCAKVGRPHTRTWLKTLGNTSKVGTVFLHMAQPIDTLPPSLHVNLSPKYATTAGELVRQRDAARFSIVGTPPARSVLVTCTNAAAHEPLSDEEHLQAQLMVISGPITMLYSNDYSPVMRPPEIICCSIPGINFEYSGVDRRAWTTPTNPAKPDGDIQINVLRTLERMRLIWAHTLAAMDCIHNVRYACLCAIGCGAFKGSFGDAIPEMWGRALALATTRTKICEKTGTLIPAVTIMNGKTKDKGTFEHLEAIALSIPTFGADNNIIPFNKGFSTGLAAVKGAASTKGSPIADHAGAVSYPPVLLVEDASMTTMATYFKVFEKAQSGILNPSDVQAIRHGWIGMYWDAGHVALEELLATCTTLLLHHVGLCRELYEDPKRQVLFDL